MKNIIFLVLFAITGQVHAQLQVVEFYSVSSKSSRVAEPPGWIKVFKSGYVGYINSEGVEVVQPVYDEIGPFDLLCPGLAEVVKDGLTGLIDREGNLVVECRYDHIDAVGKYREGWLMVARDGLHGFVDAGGREVVPLSYDEVALPQPRE